MAEEKQRPEADGTNTLSHLTFRRSIRGSAAISGALSTLQFGRDNRDASLGISSVHHLQHDVEAQDNAGPSGARRADREKVDENDSTENV